MNSKKQKNNLLGKRKNVKQTLQKNIEKQPQLCTNTDDVTIIYNQSLRVGCFNYNENYDLLILFLQINQTKKKPVQSLAVDEDIDSDEIDSASVSIQGNDEDRLNEFDDETEDRKRIRLAQQILQKTKLDTQKKGEKKQQKMQNIGDDDDSFDDGEDKESDEDSYQGVYHSEQQHADAINRALQNDLLKKRQQFYTLFADKVLKNWNKIGQKYEVNNLKGHTRCITSLEFCPVGKYLYSASKDASIIRWDLSQTDKTKQKEFVVREKTTDSHKDEILSMSINHLGKYLVTSSKDKTIKLWDLNKLALVQTFAGHRQPINAIKFGINSNTFCTASCDRQFKMWDASDKIFIDTFFGHKADPNYIDAMSATNFISCGFDRQVIIWKTEHQSQLIYGGHDYSIDVVKAVDQEHFITGSQDGSISLWTIKKKKPAFTLPQAHGGNWITALGHLFNTDLFFSGSSDHQINVYKIDLEQKKFTKLYSIPCNGVINDIQLSLDCSYLAFSECDEHRLGRWVVDKKAKNTIKYVKLL